MSFNEEWLKDPQFKDWLERDKNNKDACYCKCCQFTLKNANRSFLVKHASSTKHKTNLEIIKSITNITQFMKKKQSSTSEQIAKAELLIAGFFQNIIFHIFMQIVL